MSLDVIALVAVVAALFAAVALWQTRRPRRMLASRTRRTLLVHRAGGLPSLRGTLVAEYVDGVELRRAVVLLEGSRPTDNAAAIPLDGDVFIPWAVIESAQDVSATIPEVRPPRPAPPTPIATRFDAAPADPRPLKAG